jgi:Glycosyltransferases involved in cell wall biogenesis
VNVTVAIPTIPGREKSLEIAIGSAVNQTLVPAAVHVVVDIDRDGAAVARNRALGFVETDWVAFLDDDDEFKPNHLRACLRHAGLTGADVVYPGYDTIGDDPLGCFGMPFNADLLRVGNYIPVTTLCRTELVRKVGGFQPHPDFRGDPCEDWGLWLALLDAGATFSHLPLRTWIWRTTGGTRGRGATDAAGA